MLGADYLNTAIDLFIGETSQITSFWWLGITLTPTTPEALGEEPDILDGYQRVLVFNDDLRWGAAVDGFRSNIVTVEMAPATNPWGELAGWFLATDASGPSFVIAATIPPGTFVAKNNAPYFPPGSLTVGAE